MGGEFCGLLLGGTWGAGRGDEEGLGASVVFVEAGLEVVAVGVLNGRRGGA